MNEHEKKHLATCCPKTAAACPEVSKFGFVDVMTLVGLVEKYGPAIATLVQSLIDDAKTKKS